VTRTCIKELLAQRVSEPQLVAAMFTLDYIDSFNIMRVVDRLLVAGYEAPSLFALAGELHPVASEWQPLLTKALQELGIPTLSRYDAARVIAREIAKMILERSLSPLEGANLLFSAVFCVEEFRREVTIFDELACALEEPNGERKSFDWLSGEEMEGMVIEEARKLVEGTEQGRHLKQTL